MKIVFISDTHCQLEDVPAGDLLIHCGDALNRGTIQEYVVFANKMNDLSAGFKFGSLYIPGNHDLFVEMEPALARDLIYSKILVDESVEVSGVKIYGSPRVPMLGWAFGYSEKESERIWSMIPEDVDILVTHTPPRGVLDKAHGLSLGSKGLRRRVGQVKPGIHAFGHIHEGYGITHREGTVFINSALCDERGVLRHSPIEFSYQKKL